MSSIMKWAVLALFVAAVVAVIFRAEPVRKAVTGQT